MINKLNISKSFLKVENIQIKVQIDSSSNKLLTNWLDLLSIYWKIDCYKINSIIDNSLVESTYCDIYYIKTENSDHIAILMYDSSNTSGIVISLTDAVICNTSYTT